MWYKHHHNKLTIKVFAQPGAKTTELFGLYGDALKIRLKDPPLKERANKALIRYLAQLFKVTITEVVIIRGTLSKYKTVTISGTKIAPEFLLIDLKR
jgi:uncharacterized protein